MIGWVGGFQYHHIAVIYYKIVFQALAFNHFNPQNILLYLVIIILIILLIIINCVVNTELMDICNSEEMNIIKAFLQLIYLRVNKLHQWENMYMATS